MTKVMHEFALHEALVRVQKIALLTMMQLVRS
jgi:hypothetical protein